MSELIHTIIVSDDVPIKQKLRQHEAARISAEVRKRRIQERIEQAKQIQWDEGDE